MAKAKPVHVNGKGVRICGYRKKNGDLCQQTILAPNGKCYTQGHGGNQKGRPIVHGRYSTVLKSLGLGQKFENAVNDPQLICHRENVALLKALTIQELEKVGSVGSWDIAAALSLHEEGMEGKIESLVNLGDMLRQWQAGLDNADVHISKALSLADAQRRHMEAESRREERLNTMVTARQFNAFIATITAVIREEVPDVVTQRRIAERVVRFVSGEVPARALGA